MSFYICDGRHLGEIVEATFRERGPFHKWYSGKRKVAKISHCEAVCSLRHRGKKIKEGSSFREGTFGSLFKGTNSVERIESSYGITGKTDLKLVITLTVRQEFVELHERSFLGWNGFVELDENVQPFVCRFIERADESRQIASLRVYVSGSGWRISPETLERWGKAKLKDGGLILKTRAGK